MISKTLTAWVLLLVLMGILTAPAQADRTIDVVVDTVLASQDSEYLDPRLSALAEELKSVFRYSSYRLLGQNRLNLRVAETGSVPLPEERVLRVTPAGIHEDRVELQLVILRKGKEIFQTVIQLLNKGSIIVGGPKHKEGYLLFNISASF